MKTFNNQVKRLLQIRIPVIVYLVSVLVLLGLAAACLSSGEPSPDWEVRPLYSGQSSGDFYEAHFRKSENVFQIIKSGAGLREEMILLSGVYEHVEKNLYLLKGENGQDSRLLELGYKEFSYYDAQADKVVTFQAVLK